MLCWHDCWPNEYLHLHPTREKMWPWLIDIEIKKELHSNIYIFSSHSNIHLLHFLIFNSFLFLGILLCKTKYAEKWNNWQRYKSVFTRRSSKSNSFIQNRVYKIECVKQNFAKWDRYVQNMILTLSCTFYIYI